LQTVKAAVKRNVESAATSYEPQLKVAKVYQCDTPEATCIASTSGATSEQSWSEVQQEPLAEPPVIVNDLHTSVRSEAQNKECDNCALLKLENRKL